MNSWADISPVLNFCLMFLAVVNAMATGPRVNTISNFIFMILFANIFVSFLVRVFEW